MATLLSQSGLTDRCLSHASSVGLVCLHWGVSQEWPKTKSGKKLLSDGHCCLRVKGEGPIWQVLSEWVFYLQCRRRKRGRFDSWIGKTRWRRKWQPAPVYSTGKSRGHRSPVGYSLWGHKELDTTEQLNIHTHTHSHTHLNESNWVRYYLCC